MEKIILLFFTLFSSITLFAQTPMFVDISGGTFTMGNNPYKKDQAPEHKVTLSDFSISQAQITVAEYRLYVKEKSLPMPDAPDWGWQSKHPIVNVSWSDALNYCNWLGKRLNKNIKLPTEAQWEYVAREEGKGKKYKHSGGKKMSNLGWCRVQKLSSTKPVKTKKPNALGIYDMNGNVWEWCMDWYDKDYYTKSPEHNPENTDFGEKKCRVVRGGGWDSDVATCTVSHRKGYVSKSSYDDRGFRVVIINEE